MKSFELFDHRNKMMKLVLLVLFFTLCSVQPSLTDEILFASSGKILFYENSSSKFVCTNTHAIWTVNSEKITECKCPGKCGDILVNKTRITAYCNGSSPVLHFKQLKLDDNYKILKCFQESSWHFELLVGRRSDNDFYAEEPFALVNNNYTLVCEKNMIQDVLLFDDKKIIATISVNYVDNMDEENVDIITDQWRVTLLIKKVALKDDGKIFGCFPQISHLSLLNLTVNVPVSSVALHQGPKGFLIEDENAIFICKVDESKPKASFQWILSENGSEREITQNIDITSEQNGKVWQTNSTLKLKLKRSFKTIKCRAKIQGMAWTNSTSLQLDVKYYPIIKMPNRITVIENETMEIECITEGNPEPINMWRIGNKTINSTLLRTSFTRQNTSGGIQCIAIANSDRHGILKTVKNISIVVTYAPEITISYENFKIRCSADASPANITYELVQKWGNIEKRRFYGNKMVFQNLTYQDSGEWICRARNGVPTKTKKRYSEKSVEIKVNISAQFSGDEIQQAISGQEKIIKVCFYCHPEAEAIEWHGEHGKINLIKSVSSPAEEGPFPFTGKCSSLTLDITEASAKNYKLIVTNKIGKRTFSVNLDIKRSDGSDDNILIIILSSTIAALIIIIIFGLYIYFKYRSYSIKKKAGMKNHPPPTKLGKTAENDRPLPNLPKLDIYENTYDALEMQHKEDQPAKNVYENFEMLQKD